MTDKLIRINDQESNARSLPTLQTNEKVPYRADQERNLKINDTLYRLKVQQDQQDKIVKSLKTEIQQLRQQLDTDQEMHAKQERNTKDNFAQEEEIYSNKKKLQITEVQTKIDQIQQLIDAEIAVQNELQFQGQNLSSKFQSEGEHLIQQTQQVQSQVDFYKSKYESVAQQEVTNLQIEISAMQEKYESIISQLKKDLQIQENDILAKSQAKQNLVIQLEKEIFEMSYQNESERRRYERSLDVVDQEYSQSLRIQKDGQISLANLRGDLDQNRKQNLLLTKEVRQYEQDIKRLKEDIEGLKQINSKYQRFLYGRMSK